MATRRVKVQRGSSLLEMLVSLAILLVVAGAILSATVAYQKTYVSTQMRGDMYFGIRGAIDLLSQEIGQAGSVGLPPSTQLSGAVGVSALPQNVVLTSAGGANPVNSIFVNETLRVDAGSNEETITVTAVNRTAGQITAIFKKAHVAAVPVNPFGVFFDGIMNASTATSLKLFGDINGDGTLYYVQYDCDTTAGTLTRSITPMFNDTKNASTGLLDTLKANPGGTPCFSYTQTTVGGKTFTSNVGVTLSLQTAFKDPQTGSYLQMTKSFLNLRPRNVLGGVDLANADLKNYLQATPACGWGTC